MGVQQELPNVVENHISLINNKDFLYARAFT